MVDNAGVTPGRWIGMGWAVFKQDVGNLILITLIGGVLVSVGTFLLAGPVMAGLFIATRRRILDGRSDLNDLFAGFSRFIDAFLINILVSIFVLLAVPFCIIPAFIVAALYTFAYLFHIDRQLSFWDAMESSRKLVVPNLMGYTLFAFLLMLLNFLGLLVFGVGLLVTVPVSVAAVAVAYNETVGFAHRPVETSGPVVIP